jgi:hypothetical protein
MMAAVRRLPKTNRIEARAAAYEMPWQSHPAVQAKVRERYGDGVPLDEIVVSPAAIFDAPDLETVYQR